MAAEQARPQGYWRVPELLSDLNPAILASLELFYSSLIRHNQKMNLIARKTELEADIFHFYDCVIGAKIVLEKTTAKVIHDVGSGNGLPGIIMALLDPNRQFVLVEADPKKADFLKYIATQLQCKNVKVEAIRIEEMPVGELKCAVTRGFAAITKVLLLARHPMRPGGEFYHFKGSGWVTEIAQIPSQICTSWLPSLVKEYELPFTSTRMAIICTKRIGS